MSGFADLYLSKHQLYPPLIKVKPEVNVTGIVVIPCYNEPDVIPTLESLRACYFNGFYFEVIILINSSEKDNSAVIERNNKTYAQVEHFAQQLNDTKIKFYPVLVKQLPAKNSGAGLARKIGMDEAIHRFNHIHNKNGIIFSIDADTRVDKNYFVKNIKKYTEQKNTNGTLVYFEHQSEELATLEEKRAIEQYELYLRYYTEALRLTSFPFAFHTIGSCFTVKAKTYCKQGGMNQKKAGEDFYFLQKIFPLGYVFEVNETTVYPSSRFSNRNPFGTGPSLVKIVEEKSDLRVYNPRSFQDLSKFFDLIPVLFESNSAIGKIPTSVLSFYTKEKMLITLQEIKTNSTSLSSFRNRFFRNFNNFFGVKYLNYCSRNGRNDISVYEATIWLLKQKKVVVADTVDLLKTMREIQRSEEYAFIPPQ